MSTARPAARWELILDIGERPLRQPLFLAVARAIVDDICRGRLRPGDRLPGTRTLARAVKVSRVTSQMAYDELEREGWITVRPASGARVSTDLPEPGRRNRLRVGPRTSPPAKTGYELVAAPEVEYSPEMRGDLLVFGGSSPDLRLLPVEPLARAYRRVLRREGCRTLSYGFPAGHPRLREELAAMLAAGRGLPCSADQVFVTRGSQMALTLAARALVRPGDVVAVEGVGYRHAWESFRRAGASLAPLPVDDQGVDVDALAALVARRRIRAVYVTPHHQFPTTVTLSAQRRIRLLELARASRLAVIEDDYDHEFHYGGRPVLPLASLDRAGVVIYVGTLSKVLAPGLRIGYVVAPPDLLQVLAAEREYIDMQGDHVVEAAVAELLEEGEVQRHVRRVRREYRLRRDLLAGLLRESTTGALDFELPAGGLAFWVRSHPRIDIETWAASGLQRGVAFQTARSFTFDRRPQPRARLGFASLNEAELRIAVQRLAEALPESEAAAARKGKRP